MSLHRMLSWWKSFSWNSSSFSRSLVKQKLKRNSFPPRLFFSLRSPRLNIVNMRRRFFFFHSVLFSSILLDSTSTIVYFLIRMIISINQREIKTKDASIFVFEMFFFHWLSRGENDFIEYSIELVLPMASATVDRVAEWIAHLQQKKIFSLERLRTARSYLFRSIGLIVFIYCFISFLMFLLSMIKSLVRSFFYLCYFPWLLKESYLSKSLPFYLYFPLISTLSALISWCLIKSSYSRIVSFYERSFIKHYPSVDHRQVKVYLYPSLWLILSTFLFLSFAILPFGQVQKDLSSFSPKENRVDQSEMVNRWMWKRNISFVFPLVLIKSPSRPFDDESNYLSSSLIR